jgi:hypothetical protein
MRRDVPSDITWKMISSLSIRLVRNTGGDTGV